MTPPLRLMWFAFIAVASALNLLLVGSAALNLEWVMGRVASGQFDSLPIGLRVVYLGFSVLMVAQTYLAWQLLQRGGAWSRFTAVASMLLVIPYVISTVLNAISPSSDERWNAIPAALLMVSFFMLRGPAANHRGSSGEV